MFRMPQDDDRAPDTLFPLLPILRNKFWNSVLQSSENCPTTESYSLSSFVTFESLKIPTNRQIILPAHNAPDSPKRREISSDAIG